MRLPPWKPRGRIITWMAVCRALGSQQVREALPAIGRYIDGPPCVMRSRTSAKPICPEGERYCGIPVWRNYDFDTLEQRRVM